MATARSPRQFLFVFTGLLYLLLIHAPRSTSLSFSFDFSTSSGDPCDADLRCERDTHLGAGVLELTRNDIRSDVFSAGRASYVHPVPLWDSTTGELASFTTNFSFQIKPKNESNIALMCSNQTGDGMAFFLAHYPSRIPQNSEGWNLALFNDGNNLNGATGNDRVVAVEFDTFRNDWDKTRDHVGINVNSIDSKNFVNVTEGLVFEHATMTAKISFDNITGILGALLQIDGGKPYNVSMEVDMKESLPEQVSVGFSGSTGFCSELHQVLSWSFSSSLEPAPSSTGDDHLHRMITVLVPAGVAFIVFLCAVVAMGCLVRRRRAWKKLQRIADGDGDSDAEQAEFERGVGPRRYRYQELAAATSNFADEQKLGRGGFGNVYRGNLDDQDCPVAIKVFSAEASVQGRKAFEAEVKIISRLRHRNLVQLLGWCDSRRGLLLVYELVPEGSLDKHLYSSLLTWSERYAIILGLGSALRYLHTEWDQCVLHGDIKPSNILLGSSRSTTKLGDFGLARLVDHGAGPRTTQVVMGTAGYIDPEFIRSRQPSTESDVYSFGVVLLEIVTARRPEMEHPDRAVPLLEWVWELYGRGALLDAVDERLLAGGGELDSGGGGGGWQLRRVLVVGLWCAHPDPGLRPSIVQAMNVLQSEDVTLPILSRQVPTAAAAENVSGDDVSWALSGGR
ncbi:unnamed protein product [Urochloa decumbens]|uniref:non-specific serine/threonine protein kinase n=1 Tax=Urochloa decumbens TaxID=240449 RepID=A0ABC8WAC3_9POAL